MSRRREDVQARHQEIQRLRKRHLFTLEEIAVEVGLADHTSVLHHLNGACRCFELPLKIVQAPHEHIMKCTKCGAHG